MGTSQFENPGLCSNTAPSSFAGRFHQPLYLRFQGPLGHQDEKQRAVFEHSSDFQAEKGLIQTEAAVFAPSARGGEDVAGDEE